MLLFALDNATDPAPTLMSAITAVAIAVGLVAQIVLQVLARLDAARQAVAAAKSRKEVKAAATAAAVMAKQVKTAMAATAENTTAKLEDLAQVAIATHGLVNGGMGQQLLLTATVSRRLANLTGEPADIAAAELAERLHREHMARLAAAPPTPTKE